jgi:hypothetical protein
MSIIPIRCHTQVIKKGDDNVEMDVEVDSDDEADDLDEGTMEQDENEPWFDSIL